MVKRSARNTLKPPIMLIGNVRSGTSMIHDFFNLHPEVAAWYEPRTIWTYADPGRRHDRFDEHDATPKVTRYIRRRFLAYQRGHDGLRVMEKTPSNVMRIPYVRALFPESKLLYLVREPFANLASSEKRWRTPITLEHAFERIRETPKSQLHYYIGRAITDTLKSRALRRRHVSVWGVRYPGIYRDLRSMPIEQVIARQWARCCRQAEEDFAKIDPGVALKLRYEDFVADPVVQFERILSHFDLAMTPELARVVRRRVDPNRQTKWRDMDYNILRSCVPLLESEMKRYGYETPPELASGARPSGPVMTRSDAAHG